MPHRETILAAVERLKQAGFDAVIAFDAHAFNRAVDRGGFRLPDFGRNRPLALMIGNSRALWKPFIRALEGDARLKKHPHPLDHYSELSISGLRADIGLASASFFAHQSEPRVPIQRIAAAAGLAELSPSHMSVHRVHGPWLGLRAVVVFDCDFSVAHRAPSPDPGGAESHCRGCAAPCVAALERAVGVGAGGTAETWRVWLAVRDACPAGKGQRYGPNQIRYHYTKDRTALVPERA